MRLSTHSLVVLAFLGLSACSVAATDDDSGGEPAADESALTIDGFVEPTAEDEAHMVERFPQLDPDRVVPRDLLYRAVAFWELNRERVTNRRYLSVIDFSRHSSKKRLFIVEMDTGRVDAHVVAHGSGSDPDHTGYARRFSNVSGSNASSVGFYLTGETYQGNHGLSLRLDGVSDTNSNARSRAVVMHSADYVEEGSAKQGRSWGCPAIPNNMREAIIRRLKGGSVLYIERAGRGDP